MKKDTFSRFAAWEIYLDYVCNEIAAAESIMPWIWLVRYRTLYCPLSNTPKRVFALKTLQVKDFQVGTAVDIPTILQQQPGLQYFL